MGSVCGVPRTGPKVKGTTPPTPRREHRAISTHLHCEETWENVRGRGPGPRPRPLEPPPVGVSHADLIGNMGTRGPAAPERWGASSTETRSRSTAGVRSAFCTDASRVARSITCFQGASSRVARTRHQGASLSVTKVRRQVLPGHVTRCQDASPGCVVKCHQGASPCVSRTQRSSAEGRRGGGVRVAFCGPGAACF